MADVAKMASVSHQTVSRVLNDHLNVSAKTRTRVLRAIDLLGYRRNLVSLRIAGRAGVLDAIGYLTERGVDGIVVVAPQRLTPRHLLDLGHETVWYVGGPVGRPSLTTIKQDFGAVGRRSIDVLGQQIEIGEPCVRERHVVPPYLVLGAGTATVR
ncbi:LacI family DNA-binding transcriptional regulator [Streptosporangium sp. NBC_01495]|uniref:LacI family DNA-binding transcriptional regulator n=1 Tax=Streptosporangium sp. NBC_01495 TaxID=2903899 RepID=UPI002E33144C|nr:LacI family DNA-binding transcriptional regulator [Streptosporangium sp. NBC_01495]